MMIVFANVNGTDEDLVFLRATAVKNDFNSATEIFF